MNMRFLQHGTQMGQFPVIFCKITFHLPLQSTELQKRGSRVAGYTLMPTNCPVALTACKTSKENVICSGDANWLSKHPESGAR
jgi:hypothetical protein